jgi:phosphoglycerate-specific signal transduction histidine kinase
MILRKPSNIGIDCLHTGNDGYETVNRFMCTDGRYRWFHTSVAAIRDDAGKTIAFHGVMLDTTVQKNAELVLQQSEQQMQRMMDTVPSNLWSTAPDGQGTFINKTTRDYIGMTLDQIQDGRYFETNNGQVLTEFIDNGCGLPVSRVDNIFDAFVTSKANGMGIGLAISRSIVEAHDGQLWAENNPDFGAKLVCY